jgi:hypothetical protein
MNQETTTSLIDTALASGSASALDPEERRLQELVLAIRDDAPTPDPGFELNECAGRGGLPAAPQQPLCACPWGDVAASSAGRDGRGGIAPDRAGRGSVARRIVVVVERRRIGV